MLPRVPAHLPSCQPPHGPARAPAQGHAATHERELSGALARCMSHMLDEIDYGMLLVDADGQVLYLNHAARRELDGAHPLQLLGRHVAAAHPGEAAKLQDALAAAQRGLRRLLTLGRGDQLVGISVVPLDEPDARGGTTLLMLGKRAVCEQLTVQGYARARALTPAETRVLEMLCGGVQPTAIARQQGVAVSTVRTQIGSIRAKTGANSIRELVRQVAVLPPLVGALRSTASALAGGLRMPLAPAS
ncbi:MAG: PAS domain-containing protein [Rubrivivax sp.]|nr:PAS domain-containing protein [Rubrivivax sp.]